MSVEFLAALAGVLLTLAFSYIPGLRDWYDTKDEIVKRQIMLALLALVALSALGLACAGFAPDFGIPLTCDRAGIVELLKVFGAAVVANQSFYGITKRASNSKIN